MLRFFIQNNVVVIPKTSHIKRMKENFEVFDESKIKCFEDILCLSKKRYRPDDN